MKQSHSILLALAAAAAVSAAPVARAQTKLVYGNVTSVTLNISKDNVQFGLRAVDRAGHRSPAAFPAVAN